MTNKLYADRDLMALGDLYTAHASAMTVEGLHMKSDIAAELAHRDQRISELESKLQAAEKERDDWQLATERQAILRRDAEASYAALSQDATRYIEDRKIAVGRRIEAERRLDQCLAVLRLAQPGIGGNYREMVDLFLERQPETSSGAPIVVCTGYVCPGCSRPVEPARG